MASIEVLDTDITTLEVDAIANAANTELAHGGGVAGAISRAGGPSVQAQSDRKAPIGLGEAVETEAGAMPSRWVIHAATMELGGPPRRRSSAGPPRASCASRRRLAPAPWHSWAFGTGVGGFPLEQAATIEVVEVRRHIDHGSALERVIFAVHGERARAAFQAALDSV